MILKFDTKGKEEQFKKLFEEYYAPFCLYAKRFIADLEIREDIVSTVFATVWEMIDAGELRVDTALGYIKMSVRNQCLNHIKHKEYEWNYAEMQRLKDPIYANSPDKVYTLEELYALLYETLEKLPYEYRQVFIQSFVENKTQAEIAKDLNVSVKSVNRYKQKVMKVLKTELKDYLSVIMLFLTLKF